MNHTQKNAWNGLICPWICAAYVSLIDVVFSEPWIRELFVLVRYPITLVGHCKTPLTCVFVCFRGGKGIRFAFYGISSESFHCFSALSFKAWSLKPFNSYADRGLTFVPAKPLVTFRALVILKSRLVKVLTLLTCARQQYLISLLLRSGCGHSIAQSQLLIVHCARFCASVLLLSLALSLF